MSIIGRDNRGVKWEGEINLDVEDDSSVIGMIDWTSSSGAVGTEFVEGSIDDDGNLDLEGVRVEGHGIVPCEYTGTWIYGVIRLRWVGHCPSGRAVGHDDDED